MKLFTQIRERQKIPLYFAILKNEINRANRAVSVNERYFAIEYRYYISSLDPKNPKKILLSIHAHWQIENNLHRLLDVAYREDQSRIRDENAALNTSWLKKTALGLLKRAIHLKGVIRSKQLALWALG